MSEEWFEIVDEQGGVLGRATRRECHGNPALMHQVVHVLVVDSQGRLFLQKRSADKDIQPGKWDTSVGGHVMPGESLQAAAQREMDEELGVEGAGLEFLYHYIMRSPVETERVATFRASWDGPFRINPAEIEEGRFWTVSEIIAQLGQGLFTPNFEDEFRRWQSLEETSRG